MNGTYEEGFGAGYAQAIADADAALRKHGDCCVVRLCRRDILALAWWQPKRQDERKSGTYQLAKDFDKMAERFTARVLEAADWKNAYFGAAYATRIRAAIDNLREAIAEAERHPEIGKE